MNYCSIMKLRLVLSLGIPFLTLGLLMGQFSSATAAKTSISLCADRVTGIVKYRTSNKCKKSERKLALPTSLALSSIAAGPQGPAGPTGPQGSQGTRGVQGETGSQGLIGEVGPQGAQGLQGASGAAYDCTNTLSPGGNFAGCSFFSSNLSNVQFVGGSLAGANLQTVNFSDARLIGVNFRGANIQSPNFSGADLSGADFRGANLQSPTWDEDTFCPDGSMARMWTPASCSSNLG
jgi:hypothetical protein